MTLAAAATGNNSALAIGIEIASYGAFLSLVGFIFRRQIAWQAEMRAKMAKQARRLRKIDSKGTFASRGRVLDISQRMQEVAEIHKMMFDVKQSLSTVVVELENTQGDISEIKHRVDRLEQHNRNS